MNSRLFHVLAHVVSVPVFYTFLREALRLKTVSGSFQKPCADIKPSHQHKVLDFQLQLPRWCHKTDQSASLFLFLTHTFCRLPSLPHYFLFLHSPFLLLSRFFFFSIFLYLSPLLKILPFLYFCLSYIIRLSLLLCISFFHPFTYPSYSISFSSL